MTATEQALVICNAKTTFRLSEHTECDVECGVEASIDHEAHVVVQPVKCVDEKGNRHEGKLIFSWRTPASG